MIRGEEESSAAHLAMERFNLDAYQVQMILDLKISFDSLAKRKAKAWDNNRWTLAEYLKYRYKQEFGKSRSKKPAFVPARRAEAKTRQWGEWCRWLTPSTSRRQRS